MGRLEIRPFSEEHLPDAATLLAERHERQIALQPALSGDVDFRAEVEELWHRAGTSGCAALDDGRVVGYLIAWSRPGERWGPNVWVEAAGHAATEPEIARDLYACAADRWVERGLTSHFALVPATDAGLVDAWFRLGFGAQSANGIIALDRAPTTRADGVHIRHASEDDLDALLTLSPILGAHHNVAPVFAHGRRHGDEETRTLIRQDLASPDAVDLVAEIDSRIVGTLVVRPAQRSETHAGLASPAGAALLAFAVTAPQVRGRGAGIALTNAGFAWARERGYETMVVDWRETNLLSSRFWPQRGFERTFLRVHRIIG